MKYRPNFPHLLPITLICLAAISNDINAQTVSGTQLEIGPAASNQVEDSSSRKSGAIGTGNMVYGDGSLAVGNYNSLWMKSFAVGESNSLSGNNGFAAGGYNTMGGYYSAVLGAANTMQGNSGVVITGMYSLANGGVEASFIAGANNVVGYWDPTSGEEGDWAFVRASVTLGYGLINKWSDSTIVGRYNDSSLTETPVFVVGNGADASNRSNALEVYADGKIVMPPQGDILMGEFGNPQ